MVKATEGMGKGHSRQREEKVCGRNRDVLRETERR